MISKLTVNLCCECYSQSISSIKLDESQCIIAWLAVTCKYYYNLTKQITIENEKHLPSTWLEINQGYMSVKLQISMNVEFWFFLMIIEE